MKILILAGGYGTRLATVARDTPKALLPINDRPLLEYILDHVKNLDGLTEVFVVTNDKFYEKFNEWSTTIHFDFKVTVVNDGTKTVEERLGSVGDIDYVIQNEKVDEDLLVVGGDNLFDFNITEYISFSQKNDNALTIGVYDIGQEDASQFGVVQIDSNGKVIAFEEKPENPKSSLIAMCFYYLPKKTLGFVSDYLLESGMSDKAGDYIKWAQENHTVYGFNFEGKWYDIGSVESYNEAKNNFVKEDM
jgi:glucose-1-phosphate thymidylyltransferase